MTQTWAIFCDAYRSLNAGKMFWLVLAISALAVAAMGFVGLDGLGVQVAFWHFDSAVLNTNFIPPPLFYKWVFVHLGVGLWLTWIATIIALVSTAGIFPDLVARGGIDLVASKPIGRLRFFLTQYAAGLLFVTLQVAVFALASFLVLGIRGGTWEPGVFVAVPLVVCFFSYLFSVCVLLGLWTRSTVAALLLTLVFWFLVYAVGAAENTVLMFRSMERQGIALIRTQPGPTQPAGERGDRPARTAPRAPATPLDAAGPRPDADQAASGTLDVLHTVLFSVKTVLPKTTETMGLLDRALIRMADLERASAGRDAPQAGVQRQVQEELRNRPVTWVVGTSLLFEAVVLAAAARIFCRRDF